MENRFWRWGLRRDGTGQGPSLQTCLTVLILLVLIPTLCAVTIAVWRAGQSYREDSTNQLLETANIVAQSVQSELQVRWHLLAGYPAVPAPQGKSSAIDPLFQGHLSSARIQKSPSGFHLETPLSPSVPAGLVIRAASTGSMAVSNIFTSNLDGANASYIAIAVPRATSGGEIDVTTLVVKPTVLIQALTREGTLASALTLAVTDGTGHVIARSRDAGKFIGKPVPDWNTLRALHTNRGTFEARTIEGPKVIFAFQTIPGTPGWVAVVGEPQTVFTNRWRQPLIVLLAASALTIFVTFVLVILLARRMLRPIKHLAQHARTVAKGDSLNQTISTEVPPSFVAEFETLRQSLEGAEVATRRSHQALQQSYEALRQAEKLARIGSWSLDLATGRFTTSDMLYELNGADPAGPPLTVADLQKLLSSESNRKTNAAIAKCAETGEPYSMEVEHMRPDGSSFPAYLRGQAMRDETGRIVRLAGTVQDISERHEEQKRLATLADNLPSGAIYRVEQQADGSLAITYISAGIIRLIGVSADEITHDRHTFLDAIHVDDRAGYLAAMEQSRVAGTAFEHEFRMHTRDGRLIWMHCRSAPRRQVDGRVVWDGIARDITGERLVAEALHQAKEAAEAAERTKSAFLATMSHEIRTPMNTVIGMTRLTLQTDLAPKQRNYLEKIDASARTLLSIINDILDFSKIEAGGLELEDTAFSIDSVLESVTAVVAMPAEEKGLKIASVVAADVPHRVQGDPLRLGQVLTNLVGNAVKFTETGEVVISVKSTLSQDGTPLLQFAVRDTGIGLSADQIASLFRPFSQAGNDTFRKYGGTGLGLAICKQLVEMMGGRIWVESALGQGSVFSFTVAAKAVSDSTPLGAPVRVSPLDAKELSRSSRDSSPTRIHTSYVRLKGKRILIVDDNALNREVASEFLLAVGVEADTANDGIEALHKLESDHFDAVLMDMHMPRMDGLTTVREIRQQTRWQALPIIALTAQARVEDQKASLAAGMTAHLTKPIDEAALYETLLGVFDLNRASGFDLSVALQRFHGNTARVEKLLSSFLRDFANAPQQLETYLQGHNLDAIASLAHVLKGSAGYFGAQDFCVTAEQLEQAIQNGADRESIELLTRVFREKLEQLLGDMHLPQV